jgi:hypothetical protein
MVHVWQHAFGKPSARGYHNKEWAAKMKVIGLQPSSTGMVGGKETGQKMIDYIIPNGPFMTAFAKLAKAGWRLNLQSAHRPGPKGTNNSKTKFTCAACGQNQWGKPDLATVCEPCVIAAVTEQFGDDADAIITVIHANRMRAVQAAVVDAPVALATPDVSYLITEPAITAIVPSTEPSMHESAKRKRGRPKGSKNKPKIAAQSYDTTSPVEQPVKRKRGRPKGSKNKPKEFDAPSPLA